MQRYFVKDMNNKIEGQDAHHIKRVMRMKDGDQIIVCAHKQCVLASIKINDKDVSYQILKTLDQIEMYDVTLIQGLPKKNKMEFVSKYATMFGASSIIFTGMQRSIAKLENKEHKLKRLQTISKEAAELAHRAYLPYMNMEKSIKDIDFNIFDEIIVCDEDEEQVALKAITPLNKQKKYAVVIGPEGGISDQEREMFKSLNATFVTLGTHILSTESASLSVLSFFMHENNK